MLEVFFNSEPAEQQTPWVGRIAVHKKDAPSGRDIIKIMEYDRAKVFQTVETIADYVEKGLEADLAKLREASAAETAPSDLEATVKKLQRKRLRSERSTFPQPAGGSFGGGSER